MKAIPWKTKPASRLQNSTRQSATCCVLDTKRTGFPGVGATGFTHDWNISQRIVETAGVPVIMAGGLNAQK
jgi:phosphoribosylanthranilate isomerase